jgi:hypothetical protein
MQQLLEGKKWGQSWILQSLAEAIILHSCQLYLLIAVENVDTGSMGETLQNIFYGTSGILSLILGSVQCTFLFPPSLSVSLP